MRPLDGLLLAVSFVIGILSLLVFGYLVWKSAGAIENLLGGPLQLPWQRGLNEFPNPNKRLAVFGTPVPRSGWIATAA